MSDQDSVKHRNMTALYMEMALIAISMIRLKHRNRVPDPYLWLSHRLSGLAADLFLDDRRLGPLVERLARWRDETIRGRMDVTLAPQQAIRTRFDHRPVEHGGVDGLARLYGVPLPPSGRIMVAGYLATNLSFETWGFDTWFENYLTKYKDELPHGLVRTDLAARVFGESWSVCICNHGANFRSCLLGGLEDLTRQASTEIWRLRGYFEIEPETVDDNLTAIGWEASS